MPINSGSHIRVAGFRERKRDNLHEYCQMQDALLHAAAERQEGMENLLQLYRDKVIQFTELNAKENKSLADKRLIESLIKNILNLGAILKSNNMLNATEQSFFAELLASHGPVKVVHLARGVSLRHR